MPEKIFLITGTSRGIGRYLAEYYLGRGNTVIGCSRGNSAISDGNYHHFEMDISEKKNVLELFHYIRKTFRKLDVVINNAAINPAIASAALIPDETLEAVFAINTLAVMSFCRESVKIMARHKWGRIINIGSMATQLNMTGESVYTSTKAAVNAYTKVLAKEVFGMGITVNVVAPSIIDTKLSQQLNRDLIQQVLNRHAIKQTYGELGDISHCIDFLLLPGSSVVTGQIIYLGGV